MTNRHEIGLKAVSKLPIGSLHLGTRTLVAVFLLALLASCSDIAVNTIIQSIPSPTGQYTLHIFSRDSGATTDFSTQISILPTGSSSVGSAGNVLIVDSDHGATSDTFPEGGPRVTANWIDEQHITVELSSKARVFKAETRYQDLLITHVTR